MTAEEPNKTLALSNEILRGVVGSTAHGTAIDGQDDRDEMGICVEPPEYVCGLRQFEQYIYRDRPEGVRSQPGDLDLTIYSLRKFCRLAAQGNPSVLVLLWLPQYIIKTELGEELLGIRDAFISRNSGERFLGYLVSQRKGMTGERAKKVNRPELVEKYGYDVKFAMHALRLGLQGIEYISTGRLTLPTKKPELTLLRAVRTGQLSFAEALAKIEETETRLRALVADCTREADYDRINRFLVKAHTATALASARRDALAEAAESARHSPIIFEWTVAREALATAIREAIASNIEALAKDTPEG